MKNRKPRSDGSYIVNVSFTENQVSLLSWADRHGNFSNYVKGLIEADMNKKNLGETVPSEMLLKMMFNMIGQQGNLKDMFNQYTANEEVAIGLEEEKQPPQKEEKPKVNKSALNKIMTKKK